MYVVTMTNYLTSCVYYRSKDCKYFNKGRSKCPFGKKCFYLHATPDGTKVEIDSPVRHRRNADAEIDILHVSLKFFI